MVRRRVSFLARNKIKKRISFKARGRKVSFVAKVPSKRRKRVSFLKRRRR